MTQMRWSARPLTVSPFDTCTIPCTTPAAEWLAPSASEVRVGICGGVPRTAEAGHQSPGSPHVSTIIVAESLEHELLLLPDPQHVQYCPADQPGKSSHPVGQQQRLRDRPQPER